MGQWDRWFFLQDSPMECGMVDKYAKFQHYNGDMYMDAARTFYNDVNYN